MKKMPRCDLLIAYACSVLLILRCYVLAGEAQWSIESTALQYRGGIRHVEVMSPDRKKIVIVDDVKLSVVMDGKHLPGLDNVGVASLSELEWSPDSRAFFINESYGGAIGDWHVKVYLIGDDKTVRRVDIAKKVVSRFEKQYQCKEPEEPNIGAVKWFNGEKHLLLVAQVPPHSSCPEMGKIRGYVVEIPTGKIIKELDGDTLKIEWGTFLGKRLKH